MGLDVVLFDANNAEMGLFEIPETLHYAIFSSNTYWRSYAYLRKLSDYYRTNVRLNQLELQQLILELHQMRCFIEPQQHSALDDLITRLSNDTINSVHIAGD